MTASFNCLLLIRRSLHGSTSGKFLKIGDVKVNIRNSECPELVPKGFASAELVNREVGNLKWLMQKEILKQDIFLIGPPGPSRASLSLAYCELTNREVEYLLLTRDSTESDIKQRREIQAGNAFYSDLAAVKAAINGRVLIIDGVEKAERNVLPILNNLLENREMQLEDGRFLMSHNKYDKLLEKYSKEELKQMKLERVSEDFTVISLGLPVPHFKGHPLDPPLRSRFQSLNINYMSFGIAKQLCESLSPNVDKSKLEKLLCLAYGINSQQGKDGLGLIRVPIENLIKAVAIWNNNPEMLESEIFSLVYPDKSILRRDTEQSTLDQFCKNFEIQRPTQLSNSKLTKIDTQNDNNVNIRIDYNGKMVDLKTMCGNGSSMNAKEFVSTSVFETSLAHLALIHSIGDFCILGDKGSGKSTVINEFANRFGYETEIIALYNDLNSRDLLQRRKILPNGDTIWEDGQLVQALKQGKLAILDNLEQAHWSTIEVLSTLVHHRFLQLPNGTRLISSPSFEILKAKMQCTAEDLNEKGIFQIAPQFRLCALADKNSANANGPTAKWLNDQILSLFLFHTLPSLSSKEELGLISKLVPNVDIKTAKKLAEFVNKLSESNNSKLKNVSLSLSLRRQIEILRRHSFNNKEEGIYEAIQRATLARFLPSTTRSAVSKCLRDFDILPTKNEEILDSDGLKKQLLTISKKELSLEHETLIPDILFFENDQHIKLISDIAKDFALGSHILLIGNQGVGKNKVTDYFLQLVKKPRQYIQLHRDTTVQSLTIQTSVIDGILRYEDSPLIKAVRDGHVLVIDEADKSPLNVIAILKSLLDSGILYLADGRRIQPSSMEALPNGKSISIHPDFRIIMLANRPGFPFLGNDLFGTLGDLLSVHIVDNPDRESEISMLKQYGPSVEHKIIGRLVSAFNELRELSNEGQLQYPFSTRELVAIVKHLERFPKDQVSQAARNVFDFDAYSNETLRTIESVFKTNNIPVELGQIYTTKERVEIEGGEDFDLNKLVDPKIGKVDPNNAPHSGGNTWFGGTGGYQTAGLGGVGGPFRYDAGHNVTQISELAKQQVPEHIRRKAREIAKQEYAKRLKEIEMSQHDGKVYKELHDRVSTQISLLKNIVDSLEAREKERRWAKHQTSGDLDDAKLIEGMTGEKSIYRKRVELDPEPGTDQKKPKLLSLLVDVSGSMYRFNGFDQRLHKTMETTLMVMESLAGKTDKIKYSIVGHSGESYEVPFSSVDKPPKNEKEQLDILKKMLAHSQFCMSGDYTLEAIEVATRKLAKEEEADERFLIALSDANLERYGIHPKHLAEVLDLEKNVNCYLILIGSLGPQAEKLRQALPAGKAFIAQNTAELPMIMQEIFASTLIQ